MTELNQLYQLLEIRGELMLKREIQETIELMFYPDDYEELQSLPIANYESGMYMFEENDIIENVN